MSLRRLCWLFLVAACGSDADTGDPLRTASATAGCHGRADGSRWLSGAGYRQTEQYGLAPGEEMADLWGVASAGEHGLFAYDAGSTLFVHIADDFGEARTFGRRGTGPGELGYQRVRARDWITADSTSFVAVTPRGIAEYDLAGTFQRYLARTIPSMEIQRMARHGDGVLVALATLDRTNGQRALEVWHARPDSMPALQAEWPMMPVPMHQGRPIVADLIDEAEPLWDARDGCAWVSDGGSDWLIRHDLSAGVVDTIALPARPIPERTRDQRRERRELRRIVASVGANVGPDNARPNLHRKWTELRIDPDGYVWLRPWRPAQDGQPETVLIVDPGTGAVDSTVVPRFPDAFLSEGAYVARATDPTYRTPYLVRMGAVEPVNRER